MTDDKNKYILSINGMSKSFGRNKVLKHISMNVKPGTIMGLMGENGAGKSTMMKCLFGTYQKDEGTIILDGREVNFSGPKDALENGVAMVHQELNQCVERSVVDNMFLGRYPKNSFGIVDEGRMKKETANLFRQLGITANLTQPMKKMSVSQRQMCEIAKAISYHSKVIVLDEPTSSLTAPEVEKLFKMMRQLKAQGISLIYISHKMDEIFNICDEISVLRDGSLVMTKECKDTDMNETESDDDALADAEAKADDKSDEKKGLFKKKKKDKKDEQIEELNDRLQRQRAEFENFRKRTDKEKQAMFDTGAKSVIEKILPVVDNFERGLATVPEESKEDPFVDGMNRIYKQLMTELENIGVKPIEAVGQEFDPNLHNAVMQVESDEYESGVVAQELQKGYTYHDMVVRHSMVGVVQ